MGETMKSCSCATPVITHKKEHLEKKGFLSRLKHHAEGIAAVTSGVLAIAGWLLGDRPEISVPLFLLAYVIGGFVTAKEGIMTLIKERELDVNLLMLLAAIGAASIGYWAEGAVLIFIFALSGALEGYTMARSYRDISSLMDMKPETALLYRDGTEQTVRIEELAVGDLIIVKPGERIPADGIVTEGVSAVNQSSITGESIPVDKVSGDEVFAGTLNGQGALIVEVSQAAESSLFSKIIQLVQEAQSEMPPSQRFIERFERGYAKVIVLITVLLMFLPHFMLGWSWSETLYRAMVFLVVASPCALVASIMPAVLSAISNGARHGMLFKGGVHLENLSSTSVVAFDKTGTLTLGRPQVTDIIPASSARSLGMDVTELLYTAASVETLSEHPIAKAIIQHARELGITPARPTGFTAVTGSGIQAEFAGESWKIGNSAFAGFHSEEVSSTGNGADLQDAALRLEKEGKTIIFIRKDDELIGLIAVQDTLREQAAETVARLKRMGIKVAMLSGDGKAAAEALAAQAGVDMVYSELLPQDKVECIKELRQRYGQVVMVGDGVNDAPALAASTVGIAMGAAGSDVALDTADLVLMNDDLTRIPASITLGKRVRKVVKQNIIFALSVIVLLIVANFLESLSLPLGVVGHEGSTILVILNGLRLLKTGS